MNQSSPARKPRVKFDGLKITIEVIVPTKKSEVDSGDIEDSVTRGLDDLRAFGMAKVVSTESCEYPSYEEFCKDEIRNIYYRGNTHVHVV